MPNHFHIVIQVNSQDFTDKVLKPFLLSYSKAINFEQGRVCPLFQGRFQLRLIDEEDYLVDCVKYIHLNPVKANLVNSPLDWNYSSYSQYLGQGKYPFINTSFVLDYFETIMEFKEDTEFGISQYDSIHFNETQML